MAVTKAMKIRRAAVFRRVRLFFRFSQRTMAQRLGVNVSTVTQWETGAIPLQSYRIDQLFVMLMLAPTAAVERPILLRRLLAARDD